MSEVAQIGVCPRCGRPDPLYGPEKPTDPESQCWRRLLVAGGSAFNADDSCRAAALTPTRETPTPESKNDE